MATAALVCGILGGAVITIPAALVLGVLGLRRASQAGRASKDGQADRASQDGRDGQADRASQDERDGQADRASQDGRDGQADRASQDEPAGQGGQGGQAGQGGQVRSGRLRCWLAIVLSLIWAGAVGYLLPHLIRAADPGCEVYKNNALTSYNRVAADVNNGADRAVLSRDLTAAVRQTSRAARDSQNPTAGRSLTALSSGLQTMLNDIQAGRQVPRQVLLALNKDTDRADDACGTV